MIWLWYERSIQLLTNLRRQLTINFIRTVLIAWLAATWHAFITVVANTDVWCLSYRDCCALCVRSVSLLSWFCVYFAAVPSLPALGSWAPRSRTGPLARKYLPDFPYSWSLRRLRQKISSIYCTVICNYPSAAQEQPFTVSLFCITKTARQFH